MSHETAPSVGTKQRPIPGPSQREGRKYKPLPKRSEEMQTSQRFTDRIQIIVAAKAVRAGIEF
jgi:hypothetical protein